MSVEIILGTFEWRWKQLEQMRRSRSLAWRGICSIYGYEDFAYDRFDANEEIEYSLGRQIAAEIKHFGPPHVDWWQGVACLAHAWSDVDGFSTTATPSDFYHELREWYHDTGSDKVYRYESQREIFLRLFGHSPRVDTRASDRVLRGNEPAFRRPSSFV